MNRLGLGILVALALPFAALPEARVPRLPVAFEPNVGQFDRRAKFVVHARESDVFFTDQGPFFSTRCDDGVATYRLRPAGTRSRLGLRPGQALPGTINHFIGARPESWHTGVRAYRSVEYPDVYPGIRWLFYENEHRLEYDFVVSTQGKPDAIRLQVEGADSLEVDQSGNLQLRVGKCLLIHPRPVVYQLLDGQRRMLRGDYWVTAKRELAFRLGPRDLGQPVVIDPSLLYSTYVGGSSSDSLSAVAVDSSGNTYAVGSATSTDFASTAGYHSGSRGLNDAFVVKLTPAGDWFDYIAFIGGSKDDFGSAIAIDSAGQAYVAGQTASQDFPTKGNLGGQSSLSGTSNAFVAKLNALANDLLYSTFLGNNNESATGLAIDSNGNAYVVGNTTVSISSSPFVASSVFNTGCIDGGSDSFVSRVSTDGGAPLWTKCLGGQRLSASGVALDSQHLAVYVVGSSGTASGGDFPSGFATYFPFMGSVDGFLANIGANNGTVGWATFIGGSGYDYARGVTVDSKGDVFVVGDTDSLDFPVDGGFQLTHAGTNNQDVFVHHFDPGGTWVNGTFYGGLGDDYGKAIAIDPTGTLLIAGKTLSADLPLDGGLRQAKNGGADSFVAKLTINKLQYATYLGGSKDDNASGVAFGPTGNIHLVGTSQSWDFPTTSNALKGTANFPVSGQNGFIAIIGDTLPDAGGGADAGPDAGSLADGGSPDGGTTTGPPRGRIDALGCHAAAAGASPLWALWTLGLLGLRRLGRAKIRNGLLLASVALPLAARAEPSHKPKTIAVLSLQAGPGVEKPVAELLTSQLVPAIQKRSGMRVISSADIQAILGLERQKQLLGCTENSASCMAELGGALGAELLVTGSLGHLGSSYLFEVQLTDVAKAVVLQRYASRIKGGDEEAFLEQVEPAAEALFPDAVEVKPRAAQAKTTGSSRGLVTGRESPLSVFVSGEPELTRKGGLYGLGAGYQLLGSLSVHGELFLASSVKVGISPGVRWIPIAAKFLVHPIIGLDLPLMFYDRPLLGLKPSIGAELCATRWASVQLTLSYLRLLNAGSGFFPDYLLAGLGATVSL